MKRSIFCKLLILTIFAAGFISCQFDSKNEEETVSENAKIYINIDEYMDGNARTILPGKEDGTGVSKFLLTGTFEDGTTTISKEWLTYSLMSGETLEIIPGTWNFELTAYKKENGNDVVFAKGSLSKTIAMKTTETLTFALDYANNAMTKGNMEVKVKVPYNLVTKFKIGVYNYDAMGQKQSVSLVQSEYVPAGGSAVAGDYASAVISETGIPKGYYFLQMDFFTDDTNVSTATRMQYIKIEGGLTSKADLLYVELNKKYTLKLNLQLDEGETYTIDWTTKEYNSSSFIVLPVPVTANKNFLGWYENSDYSGTAITSWTAGTKTGEVNLYAKWDPLYNLPDGEVSFKQDTISIDVSRTTVKANQETTIAVTVTKDKGTAVARELTSTDYSNFAIKVYANGKDVSAETNFNIDAANRSIKIQDLPAGEKLVLYVSLRYNGKAYGGSFQIDVIKTADVSLQNLSSYLAALGPGEYTIAMDTDMSVDQNVKDLAAALKANPDVIVNLNMKGAEFTEFAGASSDGSSFLRNVTNLKTLELPDTLTSIKSWAFYGCRGLTSITIPDSVTFIGKYAFSLCMALSSITIPASITTIDWCTFYKCTSLTNVTISDSVTSINNSAFWYCSSLTSITIPSSVIYIGYNTFSDCTSLTSVTFEDQTHSWDIQATQGTSQSPAVTFTPTANASANAIALKTTYNFKYWSKIE